MCLSQSILESDTFGKVIDFVKTFNQQVSLRPKYQSISIDLKFLGVWVDKDSSRLLNSTELPGSKFLPNYGRRTAASWDNAASRWETFMRPLRETFHLSQESSGCQSRQTLPDQSAYTPSRFPCIVQNKEHLHITQHSKQSGYTPSRFQSCPI